jgi:hypothetical protein
MNAQAPMDARPECERRQCAANLIGRDVGRLVDAAIQVSGDLVDREGSTASTMQCCQDGGSL